MKVAAGSYYSREMTLPHGAARRGKAGRVTVDKHLHMISQHLAATKGN